MMIILRHIDTQVQNTKVLFLRIGRTGFATEPVYWSAIEGLRRNRRTRGRVRPANENMGCRASKNEDTASNLVQDIGKQIHNAR